MKRFACVRKDQNYCFILSIHTTAEAADAACAKHARALRGTDAVPSAMYGIREIKDSSTKQGDRVRMIVD